MPFTAPNYRVQILLCYNKRNTSRKSCELMGIRASMKPQKCFLTPSLFNVIPFFFAFVSNNESKELLHLMYFCNSTSCLIFSTVRKNDTLALDYNCIRSIEIACFDSKAIIKLYVNDTIYHNSIHSNMA